MLLALMLIVASCSKSKDEPEESNSVTINGQAYSTVKIGTQTWTTVNYNGTGGVNYTSTNDPVEGKLYTMAEARAITLPTGWRLPSRDDYSKLLGTLGATMKDSYGYYRSTLAVTKKLMATRSWNNVIGTNESGFNAIAAGYYDLTFQYKGENAIFITTSFFTEYGAGWADIPVSFAITSEKNAGNTYDTDASFSDYVVDTSDKGSLRFVKDN